VIIGYFYHSIFELERGTEIIEGN